MGSVKVTLKGGSAYDVPWIMLEGTPAECADMLCEAMGYPEADRQAPLVDLVALANKSFIGLYNAITVLDGVPVNPATDRPVGAVQDGGAVAKPAPQSAGEFAGKKFPELWEAVSAAESVKDLRAVGKAHSGLFRQDAELQAFARDREEALKAVEKAAKKK